jgi:hypothetical protein
MTPTNRQGWQHVLFVSVIIAGAAMASPAWAGAQIGRVTSTFGSANVRASTGAARSVGALAPIGNNDTISTGATGAATILLDRKIVLKLDGNTVVRLESGPNETRVHLDQGKVEVFKGKDQPNLQLALVDPESEIITTGTVFFASYAPDAALGSYACEENKMQLKPRRGNAVTVTQGQIARVHGGVLQAVERLDRGALRQELKNVGRLSGAANQRGALLTQQRTAAATVRGGAMGPAPTAEGRKPAPLSDLLLARCAELDNLADNPPADLADRQLQTTDKTITVFVADLAPDGDIVQIKCRSCTQAELVDKAYPKLAQGQPLLQGALKLELNVNDLPNVIEFTFKPISTFGGNTSPAVFDKDFNLLSTPDLLVKQGETAVTQILVTAPDATTTAAKKALKMTVSPAVTAAATAPKRRR